MATIRVRYPLKHGQMVLRTSRDWNRDLHAVEEDRAGGRFDFHVDLDEPFAHYKPVVRDGEALRWAQGENFLLLPNGDAQRLVHPYFFEDPTCSECDLAERQSRESGRAHRFRVFLPPGYHENTFERFPVVYMQDGQNLFFPGEAPGGQHWRIAETIKLLDSMNLIRRIIVVGVYPGNRQEDYTQPGYDDYGRYIVEELKPWVDATHRTLPEPEHTAVMGSSLGGVVSLHLGWRWPDTFGLVGCMSATFGWRDDLMRRIAEDPRRKLSVYLDSGWPNDNYEVTRGMRDLLLRRGYRLGRNLMYLAFPEARHDEAAWAVRVHLPLQFFYGQAPGTADARSRVEGVGS